MASIHQHETNPEFRVQGASLGLTDYSNSTEALGFHLNSVMELSLCMRACPSDWIPALLNFPKLLGGREWEKQAGFYFIPFNLERSRRNLEKGQKWLFYLLP